jgi:hypothetical protein
MEVYELIISVDDVLIPSNELFIQQDDVLME